MYYLFTSSFLLAFMSKDTVYQERGVFFFMSRPYQFQYNSRLEHSIKPQLKFLAHQQREHDIHQKKTRLI